MRRIRLEKNLTQKQVADACGLADATIRMYELGKANPKPATVARIAKALDVPVETIYGVNGICNINNTDISAAVYQALLNDQGGALSIDTPNQTKLLIAFNNLNKTGQHEAIKRIEKMTQIPKYQKQNP